MAKEAHYYTQFEEGRFYHIYNRSIAGQIMFKSDSNHKYFLKKFDFYLSHVMQVYAYCLLGNHFHFLIRISEDLSQFRTLKKTNEDISAHDIVSKQLRSFFQSYAQAFNKQERRVGSLFQRIFKRALITDESYLTYLVFYIHANPQKHNLIADFRNWKWSSYHKILTDTTTKLNKQEVIDWFGGKEGFLEFHSSNEALLNKHHQIEDD